MIRILQTLIIIITLGFIGINVSADTSQDCSAYNKTKLLSKIINYSAKNRCLKGLPPKEKTSLKTKLKKLNPFKK